MDHSITVNGQPLQDHLDMQQDMDIAALHRQHSKKPISYHNPLSRLKRFRFPKEAIKEPKIYTKEEILMEVLTDDIARIEREMQDLVKQNIATINLLALGSMCSIEFQTVAQLAERIELVTGKKINPIAISQIFYAWKRGEVKSIWKLIEVNHTDKPTRFRIAPYAMKFQLKELEQLTYIRKHQTFTYRDALTRVPELKNYLDENPIDNAPYLGKYALNKSNKSIQVPKKASPIINQPKKQTPAAKPAVKSSDELRQLIPSEININININFSQLAGLFQLFAGKK